MVEIVKSFFKTYDQLNIYIEIVYICDLLTRRNDLRTDRPEESVAATSSNNDSETMMKSNMFQPS